MSGQNTEVPRALDEVLDTISAGLDYPMLIVTATAATERAGCLIGFATQCSIDPVRFMVWISKQNHTFAVAGRAEAVAIHFLASDQQDLAELFGTESGDDVDKFTRCRWHEGPRGTTILDESARWLAGTVLRQEDAGDHVGFLVQPTHGAAAPWSGQLGFSMVRDLEPGHPA